METEADRGIGLLINKLANGEMISVMLRVNGKDEPYNLEANPQKKEIAIFEPSGNKVTLQQSAQAKNTENKASNVVNLVPKQQSNLNKNSNVRKLEHRKDRQQIRKSRKAVRQ